MKKALTIAGSDPSGGAGIQADLRVFRRFGVYGLSTVTALTAQSSEGVRAVSPVPPAFLEKQLSVLLADLLPDAMKTGMVHSAENAAVIARVIRRFSLKNVVVDPVILSTSGRSLCMKGTPEAIRRKLLPVSRVVTPNISEASALAGIPITCRADIERAAVRLKGLGPEVVIITGGHLEDAAEDLFYDGDFHYLRGRKLRGEYHGTGCHFSAAMTALLAGGLDPLDAAKRAKRFMAEAFRRSFSAGGGMKLFNV